MVAGLRKICCPVTTVAFQRPGPPCGKTHAHTAFGYKRRCGYRSVLSDPKLPFSISSAATVSPLATNSALYQPFRDRLLLGALAALELPELKSMATHQQSAGFTVCYLGSILCTERLQGKTRAVQSATRRLRVRIH